MPNKLQHEQSPYLLQHQDNPVDWFPWGEEAFERARSKDKPIFLSIGYATCHWCHVMEHESFEDEEVAKLMNETFVSIKVDREERPDIDNLYMTVCQMMTGRGGWPLNVLLTPELQPFHAMTYIPKRSRGQQPGMLDLVPHIGKIWSEKRDQIERSAGDITEALSKEASDSSTQPLGEDWLQEGAVRLARRYDRVHGGFGNSPKFPTPHNLLFLLRHWKRTGESRWLDMVTHTLREMRTSGLFDQVGYGFHRYSTDEKWKLPHFEKMLYDQAMLIWTYSEAYQATLDPLFADTTRQVIRYCNRNLRYENGGYLCAEDADSEGEEGLFYQWTKTEIEEVLSSEEASVVVSYFGITDAGNFHDESTRERTGRNVLHPVMDVEELTNRLDRGKDEVTELLESAREKLFERRENRERPILDDKVLTDWNGLMIVALARASAALQDPEIAGYAESAAHFVDEHLRPTADTLLHRYRNGDAAISGTLDDYAFFALGCSYLYEVTNEPHWLGTSIDLAGEAIELFEDNERGGFYLSPADQEDVIVRQKSLHDGAIPSGHAVMIQLLNRLHHITGDNRWAEYADRALESASGMLLDRPENYGAHLMACDELVGPMRELVLVRASGADDFQPFLDVWQESYEPRMVVVQYTMDDPHGIEERAPVVAHREAVDGRPSAYLCEQFTCQQPVYSAEDLQNLLQT